MKKFIHQPRFTPKGYSEEVEAKIQHYKKEGYRLPQRHLLRTAQQIEGIRASARINTALLDYIADHIQEGMTTADIDHMVYCFTTDHDAIPAPFLYEGFPKSVCTSINEVVCHGIPSTREVLKDGDIINVDVSTIYKGYFSDASRMFLIGNVSPEMRRLVQVTNYKTQRKRHSIRRCGRGNNTYHKNMERRRHLVRNIPYGSNSKPVVRRRGVRGARAFALCPENGRKMGQERNKARTTCNIRHMVLRSDIRHAVELRHAREHPQRRMGKRAHNSNGQRLGQQQIPLEHRTGPGKPHTQSPPPEQLDSGSRLSRPDCVLHPTGQRPRSRRKHRTHSLRLHNPSRSPLPRKAVLKDVRVLKSKISCYITFYPKQ